MTRYEMIRLFVLNEIADDYEAAAHIREGVIDIGRRCGIRIETIDINHAIVDLVRRGWAKVYDVWKDPVKEVTTLLRADGTDQYYYFITQAGREIQSSSGWWPFDDEGAVLPDWSPPAG